MLEYTHMKKDTFLVWMDLEMTGLDVLKDTIVEIATIITDENLEIIAEGPNRIIHVDEAFLNTRNRAFLDEHGLTPEILESTLTLHDAEVETLAFLHKWISPQSSPLCGNSIGMDRRFLAFHMPSIDEYLHYRSIDVSSIKELARRWHPAVFKEVQTLKKETHRARDDILESIAELQLYRERFFHNVYHT